MQIPTVAGAPISSAGPDANFDSAVANFQQHIAGKKVRDPGNLPFILSHGHKTPASVLMVHGLTDSPYYMHALAEVFYNAGYNVIAVLLPGHGTDPNDLLHVKLKQWRDEVKFGMETAKDLGDQVSLAGFSCGGALDIDALAANYKNPDPLPIKDLFLFSPAIKIADKDVDWACLLGVREVREHFKPWAKGDASTPETNPNKYSRNALNAVCELNDLIHQNESHNAAVMKDIKSHGIGVFAVESEADTTIAPDSVVQFMAALPKNARQDFTLYPKDAGIAHGAIPRPETNPFFSALAEKLTTFITAPTAPTTVRSPLAISPLRSPTLDGLMTGRAF